MRRICNIKGLEYGVVREVFNNNEIYIIKQRGLY